jgi:hypothetical protein
VGDAPEWIGPGRGPETRDLDAPARSPGLEQGPVALGAADERGADHAYRGVDVLRRFSRVRLAEGRDLPCLGAQHASPERQGGARARRGQQQREPRAAAGGPTRALRDEPVPSQGSHHGAYA